jgi:threonine aldolase
VFPLADQLEIAQVARKAGIRLHLDGARLFNAAVATGVSVAELAEPFDSVAFCLSKGLGAPVGSLICGDADFIERAHRARKMLGGGMRQAGILAAAGIYALEQNVKRLASDHANAARLAAGLAEFAAVVEVVEPETNIVVFRVPEAARAVRELAQRGVKISAVGPGTLRAVLHLDVDADAVERALGMLREVLS